MSVILSARLIFRKLQSTYRKLKRDVDIIRDVLQIIRTPWLLLDSGELKIYSIGIFVFGCMCGSVMSVILLVIPVTDFFFSMLAFSSASALMAIFTYKRDWLDERYGLVSKYHIGMNYSVVFYILIIITVLASLMFFHPFLKSQGFSFAAVVFVSQYLPVAFMLLRLDVYSDENCPVVRTDEFGGEYVENTIGYNPIIYYFISFPFTMLVALCADNLLKDMAASHYLTNGIIALVVSVAILFLLLSPDLLDRILPFDLRTWKGTGKLIFLLVVILSAVRFFVRFH